MTSTTGPRTPHPAWLPETAFAGIGRLTVAVQGDGAVVQTVRDEVERATARWGGHLVADPDAARLVLTCAPDDAAAEPLGAEAFEVGRDADRVVVRATGGNGLLYGLHHVVRHTASTDPGAAGPDAHDAGSALAGAATRPGFLGRHEPVQPVRMLDHWDNLSVHPVMGHVERGYAGDSIFWLDGSLRADPSRVEEYARLLGSIGINRVSVNNVNVGPLEARLLTDRLDDVATLAAIFRPHGIRTHLSVSFAAPITLGGLTTADPLDEDVRSWWKRAAEAVWARIPDFGGFVVKADSEGQPGPFAYDRDHADGANLLARAVAPHGGLVFWRAFVYNHHQDWRDRSTDRARAAYDHFAPLDGRFDDNVVLQVKYGPTDFQTREPVSPVIAAMPATRLAVELQVTQEYTGQQKHVCWLGPQWSELLGFRLWGDDGASVADVAAGRGPGGRVGGVVAVANVGMDDFWTGHPLAQANLYGFGRLAWDPTLTASEVLDEWIGLTFGTDPEVRAALHDLMDDSWHTYEDYTAPLGVGFMVTPGSHYGPSVDGYEYSPWGTYHFADRDGIGVDRTRATGTGYTGQYPAPWREVYEALDTCPDELLLFFHHVPWTHDLHSGVSVAQHVYDTHFRGVEAVEAMSERWAGLAGRVPDDVFDRVTERLAEQRRSAVEWRDQLNTYVLRKSGVPDARGRRIY